MAKQGMIQREKKRERLAATHLNKRESIKEKLKNVEDVIKKYLDPFKPTGTKPKTPAQLERSKKQKVSLE